MSVIDVLETKERFIPFRLSVLMDRILADPDFSEDEREGFRDLFQILTARFHFEFYELLERLKACYAPFDPDSEMLCDPKISSEERENLHRKLCKGFQELLVHGNYVRLSPEQLQECLGMQPLAKLVVDVNLEEFEEVEVFYRGVRTEEVKQSVYSFLTWPKHKVQVHTFARVALLARTEKDQVLLKLFKEIKLPDLKIISPGLRIRMPIFARLKIGTTFLGGALAPVIKVLFFASAGLLGITLLLIGLIGAGVKCISSFFSSRTKYMQTLSSSLYYLSLANNVTVLNRLVDAGEAEEVKEILLAYFMLYKRRDVDLTEEELDRAVEEWLTEQFECDIDFEVDDAIRKLKDKTLLVTRIEKDPKTQADREILKVFDLPSALRIMDQIWDEFFMFSNLGDPNNDRLAEGNHPPKHVAAE